MSRSDATEDRLPELAGRVVLVTGASGGIGQALARAFADAGARVALHFRSDRENAEKVCEGLPLYPEGPHGCFHADLSEIKGCRQLVEEVVQEMGSIDVLVNNAGIFELHPLLEMTPEQWETAWDRTLNLNLMAPARLTYWVVRHLVEHGRTGTVIDVSSRGAYRGEPEAPAYGAAKAGLNSLGQSLAVALAPHGIGVFTLAPGFVDTPMAEEHLLGEAGDGIRAQSPFGRVAKPEEIAHWAVCCASERALFASGTVIDINGASYLRS